MEYRNRHQLEVLRRRDRHLGHGRIGIRMDSVGSRLNCVKSAESWLAESRFRTSWWDECDNLAVGYTISWPSKERCEAT